MANGRRRASASGLQTTKVERAAPCKQVYNLEGTQFLQQPELSDNDAITEWDNARSESYLGRRLHL